MTSESVEPGDELLSTVSDGIPASGGGTTQRIGDEDRGGCVSTTQFMSDTIEAIGSVVPYPPTDSLDAK